jgi:hypothetical protein
VSVSTSPTDSIVPRRRKPTGLWPARVSRVERESRRAYLLAQFLYDRGLVPEARAADHISDALHDLVCHVVCSHPRDGGSDAPEAWPLD